MNLKTLFFLTSEFPYENTETFIENEISFLADAFDKVIILPLNKQSGKQRPDTIKCFCKADKNQKNQRTKSFQKDFDEPEISREFFHNIFSNPLKNKVLLKSIGNALNISNNLEKTSQ